VESLESERNGSHITEKPDLRILKSHQVAKARRFYELEIEQLRAIRDQRDKIMFNAGRFQAGDRDDVAVAAKKLCDALMMEEG